MLKFNIDWLEEALFLAERAFLENEVPVGAVVVYLNQIIGRGYNQKEALHNPVAHAEIQAISEATQQIKNWRLADCILITTLEPCLMCLAASQQARLGKIYYAAHDPKGGALSLGYSFHTDLRTNHRFEVELINDPRSSELLKKFFALRRKEKKKTS